MKKHFVPVITLLLLLTAIRHAPCATEHRVALVIGNGEYQNTHRLINPTNDARDIARALEKCGFTVTVLTDATRKGMLNAIRIFGKQINGRDCVGLFYFSGHGVQFNNINYLVPVDAQVGHENEVEDYCVKTSAVLRKMETASNKLNIVILDACRNNPYVSTTRAVQQGLAQEMAPPGSLIAFSTAPNTSSSDGPGLKNGLYTSILLKRLSEPDLPLLSLFNKVGHEVMEASAGVQVPWFHSSPLPPFSFVAGESVAVENDPQPERYVTNSLGQEFVLIPSGTFMMGGVLSAEEVAREYGEEAKNFHSEHPQHSVTITKPFYLQTTEVTVGHWREFVKETGYRTEAEATAENDSWDNPGFNQTETHPVTSVSWKDVQKFVSWLNDKEKDVCYRLPTEAEWEYACRGGTRTVYYWGNAAGDACRFANVGDTAIPKELMGGTGHDCEDGHIFTAPVGSYEKNDFGLYDMVGNVWEWCQDVYNNAVYATGQRTDPFYLGVGTRRVVRGGSWFMSPMGCRSASRGRYESSYHFADLGFRLVMTSRTASTDDMIKSLEEAILADPENGSLFVKTGDSLFDAQRYEQALHYYEKALEIDGENPDVLTDAGVAYRRLNQPEKAAAFFRRAQKADSKHLASAFNLGVVLLHDFQDKDGAIKVWENYLALEPTGERADHLRRIIKNLKKR